MKRMEQNDLHPDIVEAPQAGPDGSGAGCTVVHESSDERGSIAISVSEDKMKAVLNITANTETPYSPEDIFSAIEQAGITTPVNKEALTHGLSGLQKAGDAAVFVLTGHAPVDGTDGAIEFLCDPNNGQVSEGQIIARCRPATPGSPGQNIYGEALPARPGAPVTIIAGDNVTTDDQHCFTAAIAGTVFFKDNVLSVRENFTVQVSPDRMEVRIRCLGATAPDPAALRRRLSEQGIIHGIDEDALERLAAECAPNREAIVARGTPPRPAQDGQVRFLFHQTRGLTPHEHLEDGTVVEGPNIIRSVHQGTEIATIIPPEEPAPGTDVFGKTIPAAGRAKKAKLRPGKNVRASSDGLHFFAEISGLPVIEGDKLSISDLLHVGDVDYKVGNIDFEGSVEIAGDVFDGYSVQTTGSILIKGIAGACTLKAGANITIEGGCNGQEKASIVCGGTLEAKYLNAVTVEVRGDIVVKNEIVDCAVRCLGRVMVKAGAVYGGSIMAKKGIEVFDVGNDMNVKTELLPGEDFEVHAACVKADAELLEKHKEMTAISKRIAPLMQKKEQLKNLPEEMKNKLKETIQYLNRLREEREQLTRHKNDLIAQGSIDAVPEAVVYRYVYAGVILKIGTTRRQVSSQIEGPLRLYENKEKEMISVEPYTKR